MASISERVWVNQDGSESRAFQLRYRDRNGKSRSRQYESEREAKRELRRIEEELASGTHVSDAESITVRKACELWVEACRNGTRTGRPRRVRTHTADDYEASLERLVYPRLGDTRLSRLTRQQVIEFRDWLVSESGAGGRAAELAMQYLRGALTEAHRRELVGRDVWSGTIVSRDSSADQLDDEEDDELEIPTHADVQKLLATAAQLAEDPRELMGWDDPDTSEGWRRFYKPDEKHGPRGWTQVRDAWNRYRPFVVTAACTGLRQSELRALRVRDVDYAEELVRVRRSADPKGRIHAPKTLAGRRDVPAGEELLGLLRPLCKDRKESELLFPSREGTPLGRSNITNRVWHPLLKYAKVKHYRFHALRGYFASCLIEQGAKPKEVQVVMGHEDIRTTLNIYAKLFPDESGERRGRIAALTRRALGI